MRKMILLISGMTASLAALSVLWGNVTDACSVRAADGCPEPSDGYAVERVEYLQSAELTFPFEIPGTDLVAERMVLYEGGYLEDGSNEEVVDIAALQVRSIGKQVITSVSVTLEQDGNFYHFSGNFMPSDRSVLLLETDRKRCPFQHFTSCRGVQNIQQEQWIEEQAILVVPVAMGTIRVTNRSGRTLEPFQLYYKNFMPQANLYIGGITRMERIKALEPGESVEVSPQYFARGYTRFVGAKIPRRSM